MSVSITSRQGYPGNMVCSVTYRLSGKCELGIEMTGVTDLATIVNMSNHVYFNLAGHGSGWQGLGRQKLTISAETFTPDDEEYLPTGLDPSSHSSPAVLTQERL